jgi:reactive intermediate/imine deaminase
MPRHIVSTPESPSSPLYSQAVQAGPFVFLSGTTGIDSQTKQLAGDSIQAQTRQALRNCERVLSAVELSLHDVVDVQVLLTRPEDFAGMNEAYAEVFVTEPPARSVARLGVEIPGLLVSIRMTAYRG